MQKKDFLKNTFVILGTVFALSFIGYLVGIWYGSYLVPLLKFGGWSTIRNWEPPAEVMQRCTAIGGLIGALTPWMWIGFFFLSFISSKEEWRILMLLVLPFVFALPFVAHYIIVFSSEGPNLRITTDKIYKYVLILKKEMDTQNHRSLSMNNPSMGRTYRTRLPKKVLAIDVDNHRISNVHKYLPKAVKANREEEADLIVGLWWGNRAVCEYNNRGEGYQQYCTLKFYDKSKGTIIHMTEICGPSPPNEFWTGTAAGTDYVAGPVPSEQIIACINQVASGFSK